MYVLTKILENFTHPVTVHDMGNVLMPVNWPCYCIWRSLKKFETLTSAAHCFESIFVTCRCPDLWKVMDSYFICSSDETNCFRS
jgi:hypothetical protein